MSSTQESTSPREMHTTQSSVTGDAGQPLPTSPTARNEDVPTKPAETEAESPLTDEDEDQPKSSALRPPTPPGFKPRGKTREPVKGKPKPR